MGVQRTVRTSAIQPLALKLLKKTFSCQKMKNKKNKISFVFLRFSFVFVRLSKSAIMQRLHSFKRKLFWLTSVYLCEPHTIFLGPKKKKTFQFYGPPYSGVPAVPATILMSAPKRKLFVKSVLVNSLDPCFLQIL